MNAPGWGVSAEEVASVGEGATLGSGQVESTARQCYAAVWIPNVVIAERKRCDLTCSSL